MIGKKAAQRLAEATTESYAVDERLTEEHSFGWVFYFEMYDDIFGKAPIIVDRNDGSVHCIGTREPAEEVIERYARTGSAYE